MTTRLRISILIYMLVQAVLFGVVTLLVLGTHLSDRAAWLWPPLIVLSFLIAVPFSWWIAPRLMLRRRAKAKWMVRHG